MDIGNGFLDENGGFLPDVFMPDNLHPQAKGYEIWARAVSATLTELLRRTRVARRQRGAVRYARTTLVPMGSVRSS